MSASEARQATQLGQWARNDESSLRCNRMTRAAMIEPATNECAKLLITWSTGELAFENHLVTSPPPSVMCVHVLKLGPAQQHSLTTSMQVKPSALPPTPPDKRHPPPRASPVVCVHVLDQVLPVDGSDVLLGTQDGAAQG